MSSFIDKLNARLSPAEEKKPGKSHRDDGDDGGDAKKPKESGEKFTAAVQEAVKNYQFSVDVIQTPDEILVFAVVPGADPNGFEIAIDRESDILTIKGTRKVPSEWNNELYKRILDQGKYVQQECAWDPFFRKIILPVEIEVFQSHAYYEHGVLVLHLPTLKLKGNKNLNVVEVVDGPHRPNIAHET